MIVPVEGSSEWRGRMVEIVERAMWGRTQVILAPKTVARLTDEATTADIRYEYSKWDLTEDDRLRTRFLTQAEYLLLLMENEAAALGWWKPSGGRLWTVRGFQRRHGLADAAATAGQPP